MWDVIAQQIQACTGHPFQVWDRVSVGGGCINQAFQICDREQRYFVKLNRVERVALFEAEAQGLQALLDTQTLRVPRPVCWGTASTQSYIVLEWIYFKRSSNWAELGQQLAQMHRATSNQGFGWDQDNHIGATPQPNSWTQDWAEFFKIHRIGHQLRLARQKGQRFSQAESLLDSISQLLAHHNPQPSLVHGDLWSGNVAFDELGAPVIFDPAVYYGDREVDLAMTSLFGGFPDAFYQGYQSTWPLAPGYQQRKQIYNLYHILNHFNLFGGGYGGQAEQLIWQIMSDIKKQFN